MRIEDLPTKIGDEVQSRVTINGHALTVNSMTEIMNKQMNIFKADITARLDMLLPNFNNGDMHETSDSYGQSDINNIPPLHNWDGRFHHIPKDYVIGSYNALDHWNLWHFGNPPDRIGPHKWIVSKFDLTNNNARSKFTKIKRIIELLVKIAKTEKGFREIARANSNEAFQSAYADLITN